MQGRTFWTSTFARTKFSLSKQLVSWCLFSTSFDKIPTYSKCTAVKMFQYNSARDLVSAGGAVSDLVQFNIPVSLLPQCIQHRGLFLQTLAFPRNVLQISFPFLFFGGNVFWCEERFSWWKGRDINVHISKHRFLKHTHRDLEMMWHNLWPNNWKFGNYRSNNSDTWILAQYLE